jgi:alpha-glucosidase
LPLLNVHIKGSPKSVSVNGKKLSNLKNTEIRNPGKAGWIFDPDEQKGILHIKTDSMSTDAKNVVEINEKKKHKN